MKMYRQAYAEINLDHLKHNVRLIQTALPDASFLCPMVKADAYGHGDVEIALCLETIGVKTIGVCLIEEGLKLRSHGVSAEILVFKGFDREGARTLLKNGLVPVVSNWEQIDILESEATAPIEVHLKIDTGMNRLGFPVREAGQLFERLSQNKKIKVKALLTHLLRGEDALNPSGDTAQQLHALSKVMEIFEPLQVSCHALNSAGILGAITLKQNKNEGHHPLNSKSWGLRPGLMIYGYPSEIHGRASQLKPVMSLRSEVVVFRSVKAGETVSYGATWKAVKDSIVAVVPIGYADGYHRVLSNKAYALFLGHKVSVVGTVCMDYLMLDVTDVVQGKNLSQLKNEEVTLFGYAKDGELLSAEDLAMKAQSIAYEILTSVSGRVPRKYTGKGVSS